MISDVLCDAVAEIERYQADSPGMYSDPVFREKLEFLKGVMTVLRAELDTTPGSTPYVSPSGLSGIQKVAWQTADGAIHEWVIEARGLEG